MDCSQKRIYCVRCLREITCFPVADPRGDRESFEYFHIGCLNEEYDGKENKVYNPPSPDECR